LEQNDNILKYLYWTKTQEQNGNILKILSLMKNIGAKWQYFEIFIINEKHWSKMPIFLKYWYWTKTQEKIGNIFEIFILIKSIGAKWQYYEKFTINQSLNPLRNSPHLTKEKLICFKLTRAHFSTWIVNIWAKYYLNRMKNDIWRETIWLDKHYWMFSHKSSNMSMPREEDSSCHKR
jgi:hypothetical protein